LSRMTWARPTLGNRQALTLASLSSHPVLIKSVSLSLASSLRDAGGSLISGLERLLLYGIARPDLTAPDSERRGLLSSRSRCQSDC
jgi:hypothetical protein